MSHVFTTSYVDPDLDGVACAIAYAELLNATDMSATACLMGQPTAEAEFALKTLNISRPDERDSFGADEKVVILDASEMVHFQGRLIAEQVIEVIDHRKVNEAAKFPNAKIQIEFVGAAATLVAEKFKQQNILPSSSTAQVLQAAIISNTQNFQAKTTTDRDHNMMQWLEVIAALPQNFTHDMFVAKSDFAGENLARAMDIETAIFEMAGKRLGIVQLEMVGSEQLVRDRKTEIIEILKRLQQQNRLDHIFLTMLDIEIAINRFVIPDAIMKSILVAALGLHFTDDVAVREGVIMRKEMTPLIKDVMEKP